MNLKSLAVFASVQVVWVACSKRLVLHSDQDIAAQFASMEARFSQLEAKLGQVEQENHQLTTQLGQVTKDNQQLGTRLGQVELENQHLKSIQGSSVYIRWGKTRCPGNETSLVYKGYAAGSRHNESGGGVTTLCLPDDPTWNKYNDAAEHWTARLYGLEIESLEAATMLSYDYYNQDVPCAMCKTQRPTNVMIPGRANCYPGWSLEYTGYLMSGYHTFTNTDYICLDADPEGVPHGGGNNNEAMMYFTETTCTSLSCPPYVNGREVACVVCSI